MELFTAHIRDSVTSGTGTRKGTGTKVKDERMDRKTG